MPTLGFSSDSRDPFLRASTHAQAVIDSSRKTREIVRGTRRRVHLNGLIMSWRHHPSEDVLVQSERLALILDTVRDEAGAPMGNIQLFEEGTLRIHTASGLSDDFIAHFAEVTVGKCACGAAFRIAAPVVVDDVRTSPLFEPSDRAMLLDTGIRACQSLALTNGPDKLGVISLHYRDAGIPVRRQMAFTALASDIAEAVSLAISRN